MAEKEEKKPANGSAPSEPNVFDDSEFFTSEGVEDDEEKDAVRARARVLRYAEWRRKKEEESEKNKGKSKKKGRPWYKEE